MIFIVIVLFILIFYFCFFNPVFFFKFLYCFFRNVSHVFREGYKDIRDYINGVNRFVDYGYFIYGGDFGAGKTLNMVRHARRLIRYYSQWYDVVVWSNMQLNFTKYNHFEYFEDLELTPSDGQIFIYIIDEAGSIFYSRNFSKSKLNEEEMVLALNQVRKDRKCILMTSQRHKMLDASLRRVADVWYDVQRRWRFSFITGYSGYDLEYLDSDSISPICHRVEYASNRDRRAYDHTERISMLNRTERIYQSGTDPVVNINVNKCRSRKRKRVV